MKSADGVYTRKEKIRYLSQQTCGKSIVIEIKRKGEGGRGGATISPLPFPLLLIHVHFPFFILLHSFSLGSLSLSFWEDEDVHDISHGYKVYSLFFLNIRSLTLYALHLFLLEGWGKGRYADEPDPHASSISMFISQALEMLTFKAVHIIQVIKLRLFFFLNK